MPAEGLLPLAAIGLAMASLLVFGSTSNRRFGSQKREGSGVVPLLGWLLGLGSAWVWILDAGPKIGLAHWLLSLSILGPLVVVGRALLAGSADSGEVS